MKNGGSSSSVDIVFIGDGYSNDSDLTSDILYIIDYNGTQNGLLSVEPYRSEKDKFNIWAIRTEPPIPMDGDHLNRDSASEWAAHCPEADRTVVLSKKVFRSYSYLWDDAYVSLGGSDKREWGHLVLHEFGHAFAGLADEYVEESKGNRSGSPNCAPDNKTAERWWGYISGTGQFPGCSYVSYNVRPTENSIMRYHWVLTDDYGPVNEDHLKNVLSEFK